MSHQERFCTSGITYENLAPGLTYTFTVEPTKPFLLVSAEPAEWEFSIVDLTAPETTIESGPAAEILPEAPALFVFSSSEPNATYECALDGGEPSTSATTPPTSPAWRPARTRCSCARSTWPTRRTPTGPPQSTTGP